MEKVNRDATATKTRQIIAMWIRQLGDYDWEDNKVAEEKFSEDLRRMIKLALFTNVIGAETESILWLHTFKVQRERTWPTRSKTK